MASSCWEYYHARRSTWTLHPLDREYCKRGKLLVRRTAHLLHSRGVHPDKQNATELPT